MQRWGHKLKLFVIIFELVNQHLRVNSLRQKFEVMISILGNLLRRRA
jgi:hypothetical protein